MLWVHWPWPKDQIHKASFKIYPDNCLQKFDYICIISYIKINSHHHCHETMNRLRFCSSGKKSTGISNSGLHSWQSLGFITDVYLSCVKLGPSNEKYRFVVCEHSYKAIIASYLQQLILVVCLHSYSKLHSKLQTVSNL